MVMAIPPRKLNGLGLTISPSNFWKVCGIAGAFFGYNVLGYYVWGMDPMASKWKMAISVMILAVLIAAAVGHLANQKSPPKPKPKFSKAQMVQLMKAMSRSKLNKHQQNVKQLDARDTRLARNSEEHDKEV